MYTGLGYGVPVAVGVGVTVGVGVMVGVGVLDGVAVLVGVGQPSGEQGVGVPPQLMVRVPGLTKINPRSESAKPLPRGCEISS